MTVIHGTARHAALLRAFLLARVDPYQVSVDGIVVYRNHIEFDEFQCDERGWKIPTRNGYALTKRRIIRNPNPRLATGTRD